MIVKVQHSLRGESLLIYNESRDIMWIESARTEVGQDLICLMEGRLKAFFKADIIPAPEHGENHVKINILDEEGLQPEEDW